VPKIQDVGNRIRFSVERFDGGYNTKDSPSEILPFDTPDCLNVQFDIRGSVQTRDGTDKWNTTSIGTSAIDWGISYNNTMIVWSNGAMWKNSGPTGTAFTKVTTSSGKFATGVAVGAIVYQNILFCSDGTNGPWKYTGGESFYNMGIDTPSAPTGASNGAGSVSTGTYYYAVSFVNSQVVEGQISSASAGIAVTSSATVRLTGIPTGSSLAGVNERYLYRADAASGPFRRIATLSDNTTTTYDDTIANGSEGKSPILDGTKPDAFKTIEQHQERLFFDSSEDRTFIRYTEVQNPFIAPGINEEPISSGDGEDIQAIASQDQVLIIFKKNKSYGIITTDPADDTTWQKLELPANYGIIGPKAFTKVQNGIMFVGQQNWRITGLHFLSGIRLQETSDGKLRSLNISQRIEYDLLHYMNESLWSSIVLNQFQNRLFMAYAYLGSPRNDRIFWLDLNRLGYEGEPGSWAPWSGINASVIFPHYGYLIFGDSTTTGFVRKLTPGVYNDSGSAIDSYFWTKQLAGDSEGQIGSYVKDLRELFIWFQKLGSYHMNVRVRVDGDTSAGVAYPVSLAQTSALWGSMVWGVDPWGGLQTDFDERIPLPGYLGKKFQIRFDNQNTAGQAFRVHRIELGMNMRRRRT
jgi:hypothetical protein